MSLPTVVVVDDDSITAATIAEVLKDWAEVVIVPDGTTAHQRAVEIAPDLILLDVIMPETDGYRVCAALKDDPRTSDIPVIFVSSLDEEGQEARGLLAGAVDYVTKPISAAILTARVRNHLEIKRQRDRLERESLRDDLTGLATRQRVEEALAIEWRRAARELQPLSVVVAGIDAFEAFCRLYGPLATRECVRRVGMALASTARRPGDLVGRLRPERFVGLFPATDEGAALLAAERMRAAVADLDLPHADAGEGATVSVSLGVLTCQPRSGQAPADAIERAAARLGRAQEQGRGRTVAGDLAPGAEKDRDVRPASDRTQSAGRLVIVDDDPLSVQVLTELLRGAGYEVIALSESAGAVRRIQAIDPDLVLLDVLMPGPDGFEVCLRLKSDPVLSAVPVVFLSIVDDPAQKLRAFEVGCADYVGKTFHPEEVLARISHQIKITRLQQEMRQANSRLVELDRVKATFAAMLVHDLRSPLGVAQVTLSLLADKIGDEVPPDLRELLDMSVEGLDSTVSLINELLEIYRSERVEVTPVRDPLDVAELVRRCASAARLAAQRREVVLDLAVSGPLSTVGDGRRLERAIGNLIGNALKFTRAGGHVAIEARAVEDGGRRRVRVEVRDTGRGIPEAELPYIFDLYRQAETGRSGGVGLGLAIVKRILDAHGATIAVASQLGVGTAFTVELPATA